MYSQFPQTYKLVTSGRPGLMPPDAKNKLDSIETFANNYTLPAATTSTLGGVIPDGTTIDVDASGGISVVTATVNAPGIVQPDGTTISISSGTVSAVSTTNSTAGIGQPDNVSLEVDGTTHKLQSKVPYVVSQSISGYSGSRVWSDDTVEAWGLDETNNTNVTVDLSSYDFTEPPHVILTPRHTGNAANAPAVT
ncbi:MAG: head fiber protein, partial [Thermoguttaceae bacterium]